MLQEEWNNLSTSSFLYLLDELRRKRALLIEKRKAILEERRMIVDTNRQLVEEHKQLVEERRQLTTLKKTSELNQG